MNMQVDWRAPARKVLGDLGLLPAARSARSRLRQLFRSGARDRQIAELVEAVRRIEERAAEAARSEQRAGQRIELLENRLRNLNDTSIYQIRSRLDWALARSEGMVSEIEAFEAARETASHQAPFEKPNPLVSVVIATMNRAEMLVSRTIPSVSQQSFGNLQIVVVGDHCTDDTERRLAALGDNRILFRNLPERGPYPPPGIDRWCVAGANAMNLALSLCEGDFITHIDDDDRMAPDKIETMLIAAQRERAEFLWHPFWSEDSRGMWTILGNGELVHGQVTTGSIFYHRYFNRIPWDLRSYRANEPGDWNRIRRIKVLRPQLKFVPNLLMYHHAERMQQEFVPQAGERFLT